jgi:L-seryl-tRNA(Ser) seleniumtransferase
LIHPEVVSAMEVAARKFVSIAELQQACGERIAKLTGAESALVTSGCAAALTLATAACIAGSDEGAIKSIPDVGGPEKLKTKVLFPKGHRFAYDHAIRNAGAKIVEVETKAQLQAAVDSETAMLFYLNFAAEESPITREELVEVGRSKGVPTLIDAAADLPPAKNLTAYIEMGFDLVAFSGGKGLRGPQCSGLLLGRKHLIEAAFLNGSPHSDSVGRIAKVGKEDIVGLTKAVELYVARDHDADWREWENRVRHIIDAVRNIGSVRAERFVPAIANEVPHVEVAWEMETIPLTGRDVAEKLREGEPRIEVRPGTNEEPRLVVGVWMMEPDEHRVVAETLAQVLTGAMA